MTSIPRQEIHILQAVIGDEIPVKTVHGYVKLKIPAGTESGQAFKIKGTRRAKDEHRNER